MKLLPCLLLMCVAITYFTSACAVDNQCTQYKCTNTMLEKMLSLELNQAELKEHTKQTDGEIAILRQQNRKLNKTVQDLKMEMESCKSKVMQIENKTREIQGITEDQHFRIKALEVNYTCWKGDTSTQKSRTDNSSEETNTMSTREASTPAPTINGSCTFASESGAYRMKLPETPVFEVYCDMDTDGGGWLVFQRRKDGSVDFNRDWQEYKTGFGNVLGEFWLGNDVIYKLTSAASHELWIDLKYPNGTALYAKYEKFSLGKESDSYRLFVSEYSGTAIDSIAGYYSLNRLAFTTKDRDKDTWNYGNCAELKQGAWWYGYCSYSNLNGPYYHSDAHKTTNTVMYWDNTSLKGSEMKIRPRPT